MARKQKPPQAGHNNPPRNLAAIAGDIHAIEHRSIFDIGKLLIEAQEACDYGKWMQWLDDEFQWSDDTADNYMAASRLADRFRTVRNLKVPLRVIYKLANDYDLEENRYFYSDRGGDEVEADGVFEAVIEDLDAVAAKSAEEPLSVTDCERIIAERVWLEGDPVLPHWLDGAGLRALRHAPANAKLREEVLEKILKAESPLTPRRITNLIDRLERPDEQDATDEQDETDDQQDDGEPEPEPTEEPALEQEPQAEPDEPKPVVKPTTKETDPAQVAKKKDAERQDIGKTSKAEIERLEASVKELTRKLAVAEKSKTDAYRTIDDRDAEIKKLQGDAPHGGVDKLADALIAALKKTTSEKRELTIERVCRELKIDPSKLNIKDKAA
jgi:hypothetical protein